MEDRLSIIALAPNAWNGPWMNRQQLLSRLARRHQVIYSNGQFGLWQRGSSEWRRSSALGEFKAADGVTLATRPWLLPVTSRSRALDAAIVAAYGALLRRRYEDRSRSVAYVFHPSLAPLAKGLKARYVVYHAYDRYEHQPGWNAELERNQAALLDGADLIIASSSMQASALEGIAGRPVHVLYNGVDYAAFSADDMVEPADLRGVPHPRIGYVGNINRKVDLGLVGDLAQRCRAWQFVLVGGIGNMGTHGGAALEKCRGMRNVHFLGMKSHRDLPAYVASNDVNVMCYRLDDASWASSAYPLKLHEYLAAGKPVVSVRMSELRGLEHLISFANGADEWQRALEEALSGKAPGTPALRRSTAAENSWDKRVEVLERLLGDMVATASG